MSDTPSRELTDKEQRFVEEYLVDLNATRAVIRAGYDVANDNSAAQIGHENLRKPKIADALAKLQAERSKRTRITQDDILRKLWAIADTNITDVMRWNESGVSFIPSDEIPAKARAAISEVVESTHGGGGTNRVKLHDAIRAIELIGKHLGMFKETVDQIDIPEEYTAPESMKREEMPPGEVE